jgi:hypothetical protein
MGIRLGRHEEVAAARQNGLADRLTGEQVVSAPPSLVKIARPADKRPALKTGGEQLRNSPKYTGVIAQEMLQSHPELVHMGDNGFYTVSQPNPYLIVKAIQELDFNLQTVASTTASSTPASQSFAASFWSAVTSHIAAWFADATNGITNFFAHAIHGDDITAKEKLCVGDTCVTPAQFQAMVAASTGSGQAAANQSGAGASGTDNGTSPLTSPSKPSSAPAQTEETATSSSTPQMTDSRQAGSAQANASSSTPTVPDAPSIIPTDNPSSTAQPLAPVDSVTSGDPTSTTEPTSTPPTR